MCPEIDIDSMTAINRNTSERVYNTYVKYECDAGQRMVDGGTYRILKCDASKEWSDEVTSCGCEYDVIFHFCRLFDGLGGPAHEIVTKTVNKAVPGDGEVRG